MPFMERQACAEFRAGCVNRADIYYPANPGPWPVIVTGAVLWALTTIAAFVVPALESWRPISLAGLGVGVVGTSIFLWQRTAARRGARGAQTGLEPRVR